ncbi:MAG: hypothetical protein JXB49_18540 [Bacteroidales bacterium]|nr:hypothetical protein [Bacteroidales bacterium]
MNKTKSHSYDTYIGKTYSDYSELKGMAHQQGKVLPKTSGKEYALMVFKKDKHYIVFMVQVLRNNEKIKYKIVDYTVIHKLRRDEDIILECKLNGKTDDEIFCVVRCSDKERIEKEYFEVVESAWRADRAKVKILETGTENIKAFNYDFGI